jgi:hypothetical protein
MDMTFPTGWPHDDLRGPHVGIEVLLRQRIHGRYFLAAPRIGRDVGAGGHVQSGPSAASPGYSIRVA